MQNFNCDALILGSGIYGLYAASLLSQQGYRIIILECDELPFSRGSFINQARVHNGYHYPRSISTATKSSDYFSRFNSDFSFAINNKFDKIYATSNKFSLTNGDQFKYFCNATNIPCEEIDANRYFQPNRVDRAFLTEEYAFDAKKIKDWYIENFNANNNVNFLYGDRIVKVENNGLEYNLKLKSEREITTPFVLNTTYASVNQVLNLFGFELFKIKYEICEIALCKVTNGLLNMGLTIMDGPFFSVMPFGLTGLHSLTSVTFTPHFTSYEKLPKFDCQKDKKFCNQTYLGNCNICDNKPTSAWSYMYQLAKHYLIKKFDMFYDKSLFAIKPILLASELDDSRPTLIRKFSDNPKFISVLSGKINTIYDLDEVLL